MLRNRTLLAVAFAVGVAYMGIGMVGPVRVLYAKSQGASLDIISAMASAYLLANFAAQYPAGWLADRVGRKLLMMIGLLVQAGLSLLYLFISDPTLFIGLRVLEGIAAAAVLPSARALIADAVPPEKQGEAFGLFGGFFNAGFLLGPALGGLLATTGYATAFLGAALARLLAMLVVITLVPRGRAPDRAVAERVAAKRRGRLFSLPLVGAYALAFGDYLFAGFDLALLPLWMHDHLGASITIIGLAYTTWALPSMVLSPLGGRLADRARRSTLILVCGLAQAPLYVAYGLVTSAWLVVALFAVHAVFYAGIQPAVDAHLAANSTPANRARVQGMYATIGLLGAFVGANALTPLYAIDFRLPLFALGVGYGLCVVIGGLLVRRAEARRAKVLSALEDTEEIDGYASLTNPSG